MGQKFARAMDRHYDALCFLCAGCDLVQVSLRYEYVLPYLKEALLLSDTKEQLERSLIFCNSILVPTARPPASLTWRTQCNVIQPSLKPPPRGHICLSLPSQCALFKRKMGAYCSLVLKTCNTFLLFSK